MLRRKDLVGALDVIFPQSEVSPSPPSKNKDLRNLLRAMEESHGSDREKRFKVVKWLNQAGIQVTDQILVDFVRASIDKPTLLHDIILDFAEETKAKLDIHWVDRVISNVVKEVSATSRPEEETKIAMAKLVRGITDIALGKWALKPTQQTLEGLTRTFCVLGKQQEALEAVIEIHKSRSGPKPSPVILNTVLFSFLKELEKETTTLSATALDESTWLDDLVKTDLQPNKEEEEEDDDSDDDGQEKRSRDASLSGALMALNTAQTFPSFFPFNNTTLCLGLKVFSMVGDLDACKDLFQQAPQVHCFNLSPTSVSLMSQILVHLASQEEAKEFFFGQEEEEGHR